MKGGSREFYGVRAALGNVAEDTMTKTVLYIGWVVGNR